MSELSPCSSIKSTSTALYESDYSVEEFDADNQKELQSLIIKLENSVTSEQIYETLLVIRSDYSNVDDPTITGIISSRTKGATMELPLTLKSGINQS